MSLSIGQLDPHLTQCCLGYLRTKWHLDPFNSLATIHQRHRQTDRTNGPVAYCELSLVTVAPKARYMGKSNADGVESENFFTLNVIGVVVSGLEEATSMQSRKTTSGPETTTSGLTETANTVV